jgi:hypothetical protein
MHIEDSAKSNMTSIFDLNGVTSKTVEFIAQVKHPFNLAKKID